MCKALAKKLPKKLSKLAGSDAPADGVLSLDFTSGGATQAITDQVTGFVRVQTDCASSRNIIQQDGSVEAFPANVAAFNRGVGMVVEDEATNYIPYSNDYTQRTTSRITTTLGSGDPLGIGSFYEIRETTDNGNHFTRTTTSTASTTDDHCAWIIAEYKDRQYITLTDTLSIFRGACFDLQNGTVASEGSSATGSGIIELQSNIYLCYVNFIPSAANVTVVSYLRTTVGTGSQNYIGDTSKGVDLYHSQIEVGNYPTSLIYTSGTAATRAACNSTVATSTAFVDPNAALSGTTTINLTGTKYAGQGGPAWIGGRFNNLSGILTSTITGATATTLTVDGTVSSTDSLDLSLSAFTLANVKLLRDAVGDSGFIDFPVTDYTINSAMIPIAYPSPSLYWATGDTGGDNELVGVISPDVSYQTDISASVEQLLVSPVTLTAGELMDLKIVRDATTATCTANGTTDSIASTRSAPRGNTIQFSTGAYGGISPIQGTHTKWEILNDA